MKNMTVLVCDTAAKAVQAKAFLVGRGYAETDITLEQIETFTYDASTYDGGGDDSLLNKIVVIGRS